MCVCVCVCAEVTEGCISLWIARAVVEGVAGQQGAVSGCTNPSSFTTWAILVRHDHSSFVVVSCGWEDTTLTDLTSARLPYLSNDLFWRLSCTDLHTRTILSGCLPRLHDGSPCLIDSVCCGRPQELEGSLSDLDIV